MRTPLASPVPAANLKGRAGRRGRQVSVGAVATVLMVLVPVVGLSGTISAAGATTKPTLTTSTTTDLAADKPITFTVRGEPAGTALLAVQCTTQALSDGEDACGSQRNTLVFADSSGVGTGTFVPSPVIQTTLG